MNKYVKFTAKSPLSNHDRVLIIVFDLDAFFQAHPTQEIWCYDLNEENNGTFSIQKKDLSDLKLYIEK